MFSSGEIGAALPGITLFAFHGKLNEKFDRRETGTWDRDIVRVREGRFTFYDRDTDLKARFNCERISANALKCK